MRPADVYAIEKAITKSDLTASARSVLHALIDFTDKAKKCFPAVSQLMEKTNLCERTIRSKIKELVSKGWLIKKEQFRKNGSQTSNFYIIQQPQQSEKIEKVEKMNQLDGEDETQAANQQAAAKVVEQVANEDDIKVVQEEYNHAKQVDLEEVAQKKEALLGGATLPMMTSEHESSKPVYNDKPHILSMSSVFFRQLRDFLFNIKGSTQYWTLSTAEEKGLPGHQALQKELVFYNLREHGSSRLGSPRMRINLNKRMYMIGHDLDFKNLSINGRANLFDYLLAAHSYFNDKDFATILKRPGQHDINRNRQGFYLIY